MKPFLLLLAALLQWACSGSAPETGTAAPSREPAPLTLTEVVAGGVHEGLTLPAVVEVQPAAQVQCALPYRGLVRKLLVRQGQTVAPGTVLALLHLPELSGSEQLGEAHRAMFAAQEQRLQQERAKLEIGVGTREAVSEAEAAQAAARLALSEWQRSQTALTQAGLKSSEGLYQWLAGTRGVIRQLRIQEGQVLEAGQSALEVIDPRRVELAVRVPERYLADLGEQPKLRWTPHGGTQPYTLELNRRAIALDPQNRGLDLYFTIPNQEPMDAAFLPGRAGLGTLLVEAEQGVWSVPRSALCRIGSRDGVFLVGSEGAEPQWTQVQIISTGEEQLLVRCPELGPASKVVSHGVFRLKSAMLLERED